MTTPNLPAELTLTEIAARISRHLRRLEREEQKAREEAGTAHRYDRESRASFWNAGATRLGPYVAVCYVSFHGSSKLTRAEALHYLAALDRGATDQHHTVFRTDPPPRGDAPEVQYQVLLREGGGFVLYNVTKRTEARVYGWEAGRSWDNPLRSFVSRKDVVKYRATQADLDAVNAAHAEYDRARAEAVETYHAAIRRITGKEE